MLFLLRSRLPSVAFFALVSGALGALGASCSSSTSSASGTDGGAAVMDDGGTTSDGDTTGDDAARTDGKTSSGSFDTCDATCKTMALAAHVDGKTFPFDRAFYGMATNEAGAKTIRVEAYFAGTPGCPTQTSSDPDRTLILAGVPLPVDTAPSTEKDNVRLTILDFHKDVYPNDLAVKATSVKVAPTAAAALTAPPGSERFVASTLDAVVKGGDVKGSVYAAHCDSLDE